MGSTRWSDEHYEDRVKTRAVNNTPAFAYTADVNSGKASGVHKTLDVKDVKIRESRDSTAHPTSHAVAVLFDVTGSMADVPKVLQTNLKKLMSLLIRKGYVEHPQIMIGAIGDANSDKYPIQIGQFESGIEIEDNLTNVILEGNGGGQMSESYELSMYFMARHTALDCFEKRNKKGYLFIVGDEMAYGNIDKNQVKTHIGDSLQASIPTEELVAELKKMYDVYFIIPKMTSHYDDPAVNAYWKKMFGQNFLKLDDPAGISELIASTIGVAEGNVDMADVKKDLKAVGTDKNVIESVSRSLATISTVGKKTPIAVAASSSAPGLAKV